MMHSSRSRYCNEFVRELAILPLDQRADRRTGVLVDLSKD